MAWSPVLLIPIIALGVVLCVVAAVVINAMRGQDLGMSPLTLIASTVFVTGACLGFLLTNLSSPTLETWWWALAGRVGWTLGGGLLVALATLLEARGARSLGEVKVWVLAVLLAGVGALLCHNPLRDLADGPLLLKGKPALEVEHTHGGARGGSKIWATLTLSDAKGAPVTLDMAGWAASEAEAQLAHCAPGQGVQVRVLRHVERVLDVGCD